MKTVNFLKTPSSLIATAALLAVTALTPSISSAEVSIIVHPSNTNTLTISDVKRIFLGKKKEFPDGTSAVAVNTAAGSPSRKVFLSTVLKKSENQLGAYWAKQVFTGKGTPPKEAGSSEEVKALISQNPNLIGYIEGDKVDGSVRSVLTF